MSSDEELHALPSKEVHQCDACSEVFNTYASLAQHMRHSYSCCNLLMGNDGNTSSSFTSVSSSDNDLDNDLDSLQSDNSPYNVGGIDNEVTNTSNRHASVLGSDTHLKSPRSDENSDSTSYLPPGDGPLSSPEEYDADEKSHKSNKRDDAEQESGELLQLLPALKLNTHKSAPLPVDMTLSVHLLQLLKKARAPLYLYGNIMKLFHDTSVEHPDLLLQPPIPRETVLQSLYQRYSLGGLRPVTTTVKLPSGNQTNVVRHDFYLSLFSLLTDPRLMQPSQLLIDPANPTFNRKTSPGEVADLDTGELYKMGWNTYCKDPNKDVLWALVFLLIKPTPMCRGNFQLSRSLSHCLYSKGM